jgi:hypothetical protein
LRGLLPVARELVARDEREADDSSAALRVARDAARDAASSKAKARAVAPPSGAAAWPSGAAATFPSGAAATVPSGVALLVASGSAAGSVDSSVHAPASLVGPSAPSPLNPAALIVDAWTAPDYLNTVEPFSIEGFACVACGRELANRWGEQPIGESRRKNNRRAPSL